MVPQRARKSDPGDPQVCNVFAFHKLYTDPATVRQIDDDCRRAAIGCVECKQIMAGNLNQALTPIREKREYYLSRPQLVEELMEEGNRRARRVASQTMEEVRTAVKIDSFG